MLLSNPAFTTPQKPTRYHNDPFTPTRSSPLSPLQQNSPHNMHTLPSPPATPKFLAVPKRAFKPIPTSQSTSPSARRHLFLQKLKTGREDKRMAARGGEDEIMRMIFVAEQKRWEEGLERAARGIETIWEDEEEQEEMERLAREAEETGHELHSRDSFEELLERDGRELEDLLAGMDLDAEMDG